jgi:hypothetical protein
MEFRAKDALRVLSKAPGKELFLAREEILGIAEIPGNPMAGGAVLVTADSARWPLIPRWISGYAACREEIQHFLVPTLPPYRRTRTLTIAGWLGCLAAFCGNVLALQCAHPPIGQIHQWMGLGGLALVWLLSGSPRSSWQCNGIRFASMEHDDHCDGPIEPASEPKYEFRALSSFVSRRTEPIRMNLPITTVSTC